MKSGHGPFVGLDLEGGVRCIVAAQDGRELRYLGSSYTRLPPWDGSPVPDARPTSEQIHDVVCEAETASARDIYSAVVGVGGAHIQSQLVETTVPVPAKRGVIEFVDVAEAVRQASQAWLGPDSVALQFVPEEFITESGQRAQEVVGLPARRLTARVQVISTRNLEHESAKRLVQDASLQIDETVFSGLAAAYGTLVAEDEDLAGGAVVHLGLGKAASSVVCWAGERLRLACSLPVGEDHLVREVVNGFGATPEFARLLISACGRASRPTTVDTRSYLHLPPEGQLYDRGCGGPQPSRRMYQLIAEWTEQCCGLAWEELRRAGLARPEIRSLVISGALAALPGITEKTQSITGVRSRIGLPSNIAGLPERLRTPEWVCAAGLVHYARLLQNCSKAVGKARLMFRRVSSIYGSLKRCLPRGATLKGSRAGNS